MRTEFRQTWTHGILQLLAAGAAATAWADAPDATDRPPSPRAPDMQCTCEGDSWWVQAARAGAQAAAAAPATVEKPPAGRMPVILGEFFSDEQWDAAPEPAELKARPPATPQPAKQPELDVSQVADGPPPEPSLGTALSEMVAAEEAEADMPRDSSVKLSRAPVGSAVLPTDPPNQRLRLTAFSTRSPAPVAQESASTATEEITFETPWELPTPASKTTASLVSPELQETGLQGGLPAPVVSQAAAYRQVELGASPMIVALAEGETISLRFEGSVRPSPR